MFLEAVHHYQTRGPYTALGIVRDAPTAKHAARTILLGAAVAFTGKDTPKGCLIASAAATGSNAAADVQAALAATRREIEMALRKKAARELASGRLPFGTDVAVLAAFTVASIQGMSVAARDGADRKKLEAIATVALSTWPDAL